MPDGVNLVQGQMSFLFTDLVDSTRKWELHPQAMQVALARHDALLAEAIHAHQGQIVKSTGDGVLAAFGSPAQAVSAAIAAQQLMAAEAWGETGPLTVRMGLHTGDAQRREADYYGPVLNRAARIMALGHGGQILLSSAVHALLKELMARPFQMLDLGEHRLKGLAAPERIYQLVHPDLPADFPPLASIGTVPNNLPLPATEFIGREQEIEALAGRLPETRLLTLIGPGGTGKTRLALQTAAVLLDGYPDGVFFVDLTLINDAGLVPSLIAEALLVQELKTEPILATLKRALVPKRLLLVLDNFEHLMGAAPVVGELLAAGPNLSLLVTSREVLNISGEQVFPVPPLAVPEMGASSDLQQIAANDAVQLFSRRARAANPAFQLSQENAAAVSEICRRLDGLPLAIELAAARNRLFTPQKMLERLSDRLKLLTGGARDRHARQQTLRGALDWSYDLLSRPEQLLFARLEVFAGGGSLEAIEAVCGQELELDVLEGLESLLDKSLIGVHEELEGQTRFVMLETIQAYARERHGQFETWQATQNSFAGWVVDFAEMVEEGLFGPQSATWIDRAKAEEANIRAALERSLAGRVDLALGMRLAGALRYYWEYTAKYAEGLDWLEAMLARSSGLPAAVRAKALCGAGVLCKWRGESEKSERYLQQALEAGLAIDDQVIIGEAYHFLGHAAQERGDYAEGLALLTGSHEVFLGIDHFWGIQRARLCLADAQRLQQEYDLAALNFEAAIADQRGRPDPVTRAMLLNNYGSVLNRQGRLRPARDCFLEGIDLARSLQNDVFTAYMLVGLAGNLVLSGSPEEAAVFMGAAARLFEAAGMDYLGAIDQADHDYYLATIQASLDQATLDDRRRLGKGLAMGELLSRIENLRE